MNDSRLEEEIVKIISKLLNRKVNYNDLIHNIPEWDSLKHLQIIMEIEEKFGLRIPLSKIGELNSVKDIINLVVGEMK